MERATRERLTGATIFVAVAAIVVPELLSGPGEQATVRDESVPAEAGPPLTTYELQINPGAVSSGAREPPPREAPPREPEPPPAPSETTAQVAAPPPAIEPERPDAAPSAVPAAPAAAAPAGRWWVQLGSFASEDNAQRLARELRGKGFSIEVAKVRAGGQDMHRVRAGPVTDRDAATALKARLGPSGREAKLVAP